MYSQRILRQPLTLLKPADLNRLNAIHIAGTKGKGSTSVFASSILAQYAGAGYENKKIAKIGLYTSPHLRFVRERIQINNMPLTEHQFARYFFETWDRLEASAVAAGLDPKDSATKPAYFRFLTLMAFHTYLSEQIDAAVIECGIGGEYDSTNILLAPVVTGIASLGIDHVGILGATIEEIAWHKAGIMKKGAKCLTSADQKPEALQVLKERAMDKSVELEVVEVPERIRSGDVRLGLQADFQKINASLAVAVANEWLKRKGIEIGTDSITDQVKKGLLEVRWGGRCETRQEKGITWYIDGGHTLDSIKLAGKWFADQIQSSSQPGNQRGPRVLIFNQQTRDATALATVLHDTLTVALEKERPFSHAIFCTNTTFKDTGFRPDLVKINENRADLDALRVQRDLARTWAEIDASTNVQVVRTIEEAVVAARSLVPDAAAGDSIHILVTGSLHLVGGFLEVLDTAASPPYDTQ
jgi:folylpolyglutamate synthase